MCPEVKDPKKQSSALATLFEGEKANLSAFVKGIDPKAWETFALLALDNQAIARCRPITIINALRTNARLSLPLDGVHAALVPYGDECTHVTGYPGYTALYVRHAGATHADAEVVFEGDDFEVTKGTDPKILHSTSRKIDHTDPEKIVATYAVVHLKNGVKKFWVCWRDELDAIREGALKRAKGRKSPYDGGLTLVEMFRKAPLIRVRKGLNMTEGVQALLAEVEREEMLGPVVDAEGEVVTASSVDELLDARKKKNAEKEERSAQAETDGGNDAGFGEEEPTKAAEIPRELFGIPIEVDWEKVRGENFGGSNKTFATMTPAQFVERYVANKDDEIVKAARGILKRGQEIYAEGKTPPPAFQSLALAFHFGELGQAF